MSTLAPWAFPISVLLCRHESFDYLISCFSPIAVFLSLLSLLSFSCLFLPPLASSPTHSTFHEELVFSFPFRRACSKPSFQLLAARLLVAVKRGRMDFTFRCNSLKCRTQLNDRAVVTTCRCVPHCVFPFEDEADISHSHIFCNGCSDSLGLTAPVGGHRICPACQTSLPNPDDAVCTQLNPTEDYKTSVLSGLTPSTIMECAGRGLAFWSYQSTQEMYVKCQECRQHFS